ncbi:helix-turn-helix domain-containing protein [Metaclostridioides mangenotii]|uniref:helix-turn-helix domain-containing protein n=1 Tax=Metaclostridioides mangenotii TaxID=1540 RepID=UPI0005714C00|nr:helix-turn-helix transcriptional regulator [Clostridioides mangenotii]
MSDNIFGNRLKKLRNSKDMTGEELGKIFNVTKVAVSNWESGRRSPSPETLKSIADYFEVSTDYLLGRIEMADDALIKKNDVKYASYKEITNDDELIDLMIRLKELDPQMQAQIKKMMNALISDDEI